MTELPIHITTHHLTLSDALRRFSREKIAPITRFANDALGAEIVLRHHSGAVPRFSASARLALPGADVHGRAVHRDLYGAIGQLFKKLARRCRQRKTRLKKSAVQRVAKTSYSAMRRHASRGVMFNFAPITTDVP
jgi:ribosomal subunit interface protein